MAFYGNRDEQTICAVATPQGVGGISVIRISGKDIVNIGKSICHGLPENIESHKVYFSKIYDGLELIDEALVCFFLNGKSYTGEDCLEISCHGSPLICRQILNLLVKKGATIADRGEFTYRAFKNGKIDLVQAEGVLELIENQSQLGKKQASILLSGLLSKQILRFEDDIIWCLANIEAGIDFSTEGFDPVDIKLLLNRLSLVKAGLSKMEDSYTKGKILKDGLRIGIVGTPNAGKSTLFNLLLEEDRAIVSNIAGTTRDIIESELFHGGIKFRLYDTAGVNLDTTNVIEKIGIQRGQKLTQESDFVLLIVDPLNKNLESQLNIIQSFPAHKSIIFINKCDLFSSVELASLQKNIIVFTGLPVDRVCLISCMSPDCRQVVLDLVVSQVQINNSEDATVLVSSRQREYVSKALNQIATAIESINEGLGGEFVAIHLREALSSIHCLLGKDYDDQILDRVFKEFCIGK